MNILAGKYKGRVVKSPNDEKTHPMGSREKLALFNMLTPYLENADVLDAFAGSGALGLEALSRGANSVVFLEKSKKIIKIIEENCSFLPVEVDWSAEQSSAENFRPDRFFDIIIADPPYDLFTPEMVEPLLAFLKPSGIFVLSSSKTSNPPVFEGLNLLKTHIYAAASISVYEKL